MRVQMSSFCKFKETMQVVRNFGDALTPIHVISDGWVWSPMYKNSITLENVQKMWYSSQHTWSTHSQALPMRIGNPNTLI